MSREYSRRGSDDDGAGRTAPGATRFRPGVRLKFNLVLLPVLTVLIGLFAWFDYRHELSAVMEAHTIHAGATSGRVSSGPVSPATTPEAVARRALEIHGAFGLLALVLIVIVVNGTVWRLILHPVDRIRQRIERMTRGEWRGGGGSVSDDEVGQLSADFDRLGLAVDALAGQLLHAERLATLALVARRLEGAVIPEVQRVVAAVGRLQEADHPPGGEFEEIRGAATRIVAAMRGLDRLFTPRLPNDSGTRPRV